MNVDSVTLERDGKVFMVRIVQIIGTRTFVASAWERVFGSLIKSPFSCFSFTHGPNGQVGSGEALKWGKVGSDPDETLYANMPVGKWRTWAVNAAYEARFQAAYQLIYETFPWLKEQDREESRGEVLFLK